MLTTDTLRLLRLHGFALTFYGGKSLHATEEKTWRSALDGLAASLTRDATMSAEKIHELIDTIGSTLFDLNAVESASAGAAVAAAISSGAAKV